MYGVSCSVKRAMGEECEVGIEDYDGVIEGSIVAGMLDSDGAPVSTGLKEGACDRICHGEVVSTDGDAVHP